MTQDYHIRPAIGKDAPNICKLRRKIWLATYPSEEYNISRELLLKVFDFTAPQTIAHYRRLITGETSNFTDDEIVAQENYAINCEVASKIGDIGLDESEADIEKFWVVEQGKGMAKKMLAYASANRRGNVLSAIYVDPYQQSRGIGQKLFTMVEEYLNPDKPITLRVVSYNQHAIDYYVRRGFVKIDTQAVDIDAGRIFPSDLMCRHVTTGE